MGEFAMDLDIPDEVFSDPGIQILENCANDVVVLSNVSGPLKTFLHNTLNDIPVPGCLFV